MLGVAEAPITNTCHHNDTPSEPPGCSEGFHLPSGTAKTALSQKCLQGQTSIGLSKDAPTLQEVVKDRLVMLLTPMSVFSN